MKAPRLFKTIALCSAIVTLAGCTAFSSFNEIEALNEAQPVGSPFTKSLAEEYRLFTNAEADDGFDYPDALHFARKGLAAASGETVLPEPLADWNIKADETQNLAAARGRLIKAFDLGARELSPALSGRAQVKFDCWIERAEESKNGEITECQTQFEDTMAELEALTVEPEPAPEPEVIDVIPPQEPELLTFDVDPDAPLRAENAMYLVFFNWDSSALESGAENVIQAVADEVDTAPPSAVNVVGHTDTSGNSAYNKRLAFKRANTVRDSLVNKGVDATLIQTDAMGETDLLVPTSDDVREPANRRVNISFN